LHKYVAFIIGDKDLAQLATKYSLNEKYATECQNLLVQALEDSLFGLWSSLSTNVVGDTATALKDPEIRASIAKLDTLNYDLSECAFFFHPFVYWNQLGGITAYYSKNISDFSFIKTGNFGPMDKSRGLKGVLFDIPVFTSSRVVSGLATYRNILAHKSALGFAIQTRGGQRVRVQAENAIRNLGMLTVVDMIYGVAVLREPAAVLINANSALVTS
jgi:hypothetical protein